MNSENVTITKVTDGYYATYHKGAVEVSIPGYNRPIAVVFKSETNRGRWAVSSNISTIGSFSHFSTRAKAIEWIAAAANRKLAKEA